MSLQRTCTVHVYVGHYMCLVIQYMYMSLQPANESIIHVQYMYTCMLITICALLYSTCTCHYNQLMKAFYMYSTCIHVC